MTNLKIAFYMLSSIASFVALFTLLISIMARISNTLVAFASSLLLNDSIKLEVLLGMHHN